jgi:hypothetical protein
MMQALTPQPGLLPPKPNCLVWYAGDPCDELIEQYRQAAEQHQLQEWRVSVTAPLQKQIADQQKQIADQQSRIEALQLKTVAAQQSEASHDVLLRGVGASVGAALAFLLVIASFRRLARGTSIPKREPNQAASA